MEKKGHLKAVGGRGGLLKGRVSLGGLWDRQTLFFVGRRSPDK